MLLEDDTPVHHAPRRTSLLEKQEIEKHVSQWLEIGVLRLSCSEFSSPIVLAEIKTFRKIQEESKRKFKHRWKVHTQRKLPQQLNPIQPFLPTKDNVKNSYQGNQLVSDYTIPIAVSRCYCTSTHAYIHESISRCNYTLPFYPRCSSLAYLQLK